MNGWFDDFHISSASLHNGILMKEIVINYGSDQNDDDDSVNKWIEMVIPTKSKKDKKANPEQYLNEIERKKALNHRSDALWIKLLV